MTGVHLMVVAAAAASSTGAAAASWPPAAGALYPARLEVAVPPLAPVLPPPLELAQQNLDSTIIRPGAGSPPALGLDFPRRRPGLWEMRNAASDNLGMPPTAFCIGEQTDTARNHLDRVPGEKGSCSIGPFKRAGISWVAESVCKESRTVVVSQSIASGDFQTQYRIDTLVFYSPPLANNKREDREAVTGRFLGPCAAGQRPGDLIVPGMGVLNMSDGSLRPDAARSGQDNRTPASPGQNTQGAGK